MGLSAFWARLSPFARLRQVKALQGVHSAEQFRAILERERAWADRNQSQFSVVVFGVGNPEADSTQVRHLAHVLANRIRLTDYTGWFDGSRIGAILPETSADGAWRLADDVCQTVAAKASPPECTVYTYPSKWFSNGSEHSTQLHFADLSAEWKTTTPRRFSMSAKYAGGLSTDFATQQSPADATPNCRPVAEPLEPFLVRPLPVWKRVMDIVGAVAGLILFSPIMLATVVVVKLSSPGPIIFEQKRAGLGGKPFIFYKFRTMVDRAEVLKEDLVHSNEQTGPVFKIRDDPRITRVGRFLRKMSIDELPQLWNVLKGDMSLVGPRPLPLEESEACDGWHRRRLEITPGLTCIWQVSGRCEIGFENWARMDIRYAQSRSLIRDLKIVLRTVRAVLSRRGAY